MISIRLSRVGKRNRPYYRVVVTQTRSKRDGKNIDQIGHWDPQKKLFSVDKQKLDKYLGNGAVISKTVDSLIQKHSK